MWLKKTAAAVGLALYLATLHVNAQVGKSCQTPNGESATCKSIYDCPLFLSILQTRNDEQERFLRESQCGQNTSPVVCCGSKTNFASRASNEEIPDTLSSRTGEIPRNDAIPDRSSCGSQFSEKIFNGENTTIEDFPWMALLEYEDKAGNRRYSCGGTIISNRYVLTAAHCVARENRRRVGNLVTVRLGEWNTDTLVDCVENLGIKICNNPPEDFGIEQALVHPNYDTALANRYYDIALLRLNREIQYSNFVQPICLPLLTESSNVGEQLIVAGWGTTATASRSPIKQKLELPIADRSQCISKFRSAGITLDDTQICAGGIAGEDSCSGDSGGPLMRLTSNDSSQWYIEGLVSFGAKCGSADWPGIYTRVSAYLNWIHRTVKP